MVPHIGLPCYGVPEPEMAPLFSLVYRVIPTDRLRVDSPATMHYFQWQTTMFVRAQHCSDFVPGCDVTEQT